MNKLNEENSMKLAMRVMGRFKWRDYYSIDIFR